MRVHFGLGTVPKIDWIDVRWPSGLVERFEDVSSDRILTLKEGSGKQVDANAAKK